MNKTEKSLSGRLRELKNKGKNNYRHAIKTFKIAGWQ